jgi:hypothetical protein
MVAVAEAFDRVEIVVFAVASLHYVVAAYIVASSQIVVFVVASSYLKIVLPL